MAVKLNYALPPEVIEDKNKVETVSTSIRMEEVEPEEVLRVLHELHDQNYDITVNFKIKAKKQ